MWLEYQFIVVLFQVIKQIIDECEIIRIGLCDEDQFPYIVPLNFAYEIQGEQI